MPDATIVRRIPAPPAVAWRALTTPEELAAWFWPTSFATRAVLEAAPGGRLRLESATRGMGVEGRVLEVEPVGRLVTTWRWDGEDSETTVTIRVVPAGDGCEVHVRQEGFATDEGARDHERGWTDCLDRLAVRLGSAG